MKNECPFIHFLYFFFAAGIFLLCRFDPEQAVREKQAFDAKAAAAKDEKAKPWLEL